MLYLTFAALAIVLFCTRKDWTLKPTTLLQWYLLFTIVFYFYRWTFQWGPPETTRYEGDAPAWIRIIKDLVFVAFVSVCIAKGKFKYSPLVWYVTPFVVWLWLCTFVKLLKVEDSHNILFHWHTSLEYIPLAFVVFEEDIERLLKFALGCCWVVVAFLALEIFSGRTSGFLKDEALFSRYGSIFGSPNELGIFAVLALLGVLAFSDRIPKATKFLLLPALSSTLVLSGSRSSILGFVAGLISMWPRSKKWLLVIAVISVVFYLSLFTVFQDTTIVDDLISRVGDVSAASRIDQLEQVKAAVNSWGIAGIVFGGWEKIDQENYYLSLLLRTGLLGVLLLCTIVVVTLVRARDPFLRGGIVSILTASLFVPYLDIFPPNVYFWLMVGTVWSLAESRSPAADPAANGSVLTAWAQRVRT
jgi:hypothetical protein